MNLISHQTSEAGRPVEYLGLLKRLLMLLLIPQIRQLYTAATKSEGPSLTSMYGWCRRETYVTPRPLKNCYRSSPISILERRVSSLRSLTVAEDCVLKWSGKAADFVQLETATFNLEADCCSHHRNTVRASQIPPTRGGKLGDRGCSGS